jgi:hypothetical protein
MAKAEAKSKSKAAITECDPQYTPAQDCTSQAKNTMRANVRR